jgi:hypothetical protein
MDPRQPSLIEEEVTLRLVSAVGTATPIQATFHYTSKDPYAVHVLFHNTLTRDSVPVLWGFARELLTTGLNEPSGIGDVRVWPWYSPRGDFIALALTSPDGNALYEVPRKPLARFLQRTYVAVPLNRESDFIDHDETVRRLLQGR